MRVGCDRGGVRVARRGAAAPDDPVAIPLLYRRRAAGAVACVVVPLSAYPRRLSPRGLRPSPELVQRRTAVDAPVAASEARPGSRLAARPPWLFLARYQRRVHGGDDR